MNASYYVRLFLLCAEVFFLVHFILAVIITLLTPYALNAAAQMRAGRAAKFLFGLRLLPAVAALFAVLTFCVPSYLLLEPFQDAERVGLLCLLFVAILAAQWCSSVFRTSNAIVKSWRYIVACQKAALIRKIPGETSTIWEIPGRVPFLAVAGLARHQFIASGKVIDLLSEDELKVALQHERAHATSLDNLKHLVFLALPGVLPGLHGFRNLEQAWSSFAERSADDAATAGDPHRGVLLAAALVRIAKFQQPSQSQPMVSYIITDGSELASRVSHLLGRSTQSTSVSRMLELALLLTGASPVFLSAILFTQPQLMTQAFEFLEHSLR